MMMKAVLNLFQLDVPHVTDVKKHTTMRYDFAKNLNALPGYIFERLYVQQYVRTM